jgi:hypothetical protein
MALRRRLGHVFAAARRVRLVRRRAWARARGA